MKNFFTPFWFFLLLLLAIRENLYAQSVVWAKTYGGTNKDKGRDISVDAESNCYIAGFFTDQAVFGSIVLNALGNDIDEDIYILKLDMDGNPVWAHNMGNGIENHADFPFGFSANKDGYSVITGDCKNYLEFEDGTIIPGIGENDLFLAVYDKDGSRLWAKVGGGLDIDMGTGVFIDDDGFIYCTGNYVGECDFFGDTLLQESGGTQHHVYVAKYDLAGDLVWIETLSSQTNFEARTVTGDNLNSIYVGGNFANTVTVNNSDLTALGAEDGWLAKYNTDGNFQWAKSFGSSESDSYECAYTIATDQNDNVYTATVFKKNISFDGNMISTDIDQNVAIAAFDGNGLYKWSNRITAGPDGKFSIHCLGLLAEDNIILTGCFAGTDTVGGEFVITPYGADPAYGDAFYAAFNIATGDAAWAMHVGGEGADAGHGLAGNHTGFGYAAGHYKDAGTFGSFQLTSAGETDIFVIKFNQNDFMGVNGGLQGNMISAFPNPTTGELTVALPLNVTMLTVTDAVGRIIMQEDVTNLAHTTVQFSGLSAGMYHLHLSGGKEVYSSKVVLQH